MKRAESAPKDAEKLLGPASRGPGGKDVLQDAGELVHKYGEDMTYDRNGNVTSHGRRGVKGSTGWEVRYFTADHLGSTRVVTDIAGTILEQFDYLPYGERCINSGLAVANTDKTDYLYGGKELPQLFGIDWYDSAARWQTTSGIFVSPDPLMEKYYSISPYAYCAGNPVNLVDPEGKSTRVVANADGTYTVVGGDITDNDLSVYCGYFKDGDFVVDCVIGVTTTLTSFYDSDSGSWQNAIINLEDKSGIEFFETIINDRPSLMTYVFNAGNTRKYDFKSTNGSDSVVYNADQYYRGMPLGDGIITSARDIGNMVAGYMCGVNGIPYGVSRHVFDVYQSYSDTKANIKKGDSFPLTFSKEGDTTINAQRLGWRMGQIHRRMK